MRLTQLRALLKSFSPDEMALRVGNSNNEGINFTNLENFKRLLDRLKDYPFFEKEVDYLTNSILYRTTANVLFVTKQSQSDQILTLASELIAQLYGLSIIIPKMVEDEGPEGISIKLPNTSDLGTLIGDLETFKQSIEQVILDPEIGGKIEVKKWENGSFWIDLYLGTSAAATLIGGVTWSALVLCKKYAEFEILLQTAKSLKIKNASLEDIRSQQETLISSLVTSEATYLEQQAYSSKHENERMERIKKTVKVFATLIQKGAEVHPSLLAPESVKNLFPDFKNSNLIESKIPLLQDESKAKE